MKHIKTFEENSKYKIDDYIFDKTSLGKYKIIEIRGVDNVANYIIKNYSDDNKGDDIGDERYLDRYYITELEYNTNKYNI